ncbi:hemagglutinin repeat-containing protein [Gallibacterium sp. AGMB14963]|uniref:two-partner secretion domain-containing protein n=1 Tax=Gallibacterium faecale TaxID=3019086 RepID=UPI0022F1AC19|nr:hemagglutinin repeat-containing protein [Gallibacterium sp. AGMB14963]MDA3979221.1 hemagglutinin repeat-containing protein [Gallibacterium sp. AGMB14963]
MNKHLYRIIFSKTLQRLVVVSEIATREGKAKHEGQHCHTASLSQRPHWRLKALTIGLYSLLGFFYLTSAHADELQIRADNTAPKNQQPIVLQTANGLPQVNIQTPNDKGLSHNKYQQFDVAQKGAILNNSRKNTQTEQGGWVQANPYLVGGEAKVILNEVNATKPSQLKGYIEVAGGKADVIIANPSGIHCEGCGIINAGRSTFTTGEVQIENGQVTGYRVEKGAVTVSGRGFDSSRQDYTDIIAKEVKINAGIWANELKVTTGQNQVSANNDSIQVIRAGEASQPVGYAVDVAELGGMYANKIHLIGTENGLGVRNAGHIGAAVGEVKVTTEGQLVNTGYIGAQQDITLQSQYQIENQASGVMYSQQGNLQATSKQQGIQQQSSLLTKGKAQGKGNITLKAKEAISQSGESLAKGNITYQAKHIETHPTAKLIAGGTFTHTAQGEQVTIPAYHSAGNALNLIAEETISSHGKHLASTQITAQAKQLDFSQSGFLAYQADLTATQNNLVLDQSHLELKNTLHLSTPTHLSSQQANLQATHIFTTASSLDNRLGTWINRDQQPFNLRLLKGINNQQGQIFTQGNFNLLAQEINNQQGLLFAKGNLTLNSQQTRINNQQGVINTEGQLDLQSGELINDSGLIQSLAAMAIDTHQQRLSNQATKQSSRQQGIISFDKLTVKTGELINQNGFIASHQNQQITATQIDNSEGLIQSDNTQHLISLSTLNNTQGQIVASNNLLLDTDALNNYKGLIVTENGQLTLQGRGQLTNWQGNLLSRGDATISVLGLDNAQQGLISSAANLVIDTHQSLLRNEQGMLFVQQSLYLDSGELNNQQGLIHGQTGITINTHNHTLNNQQTQHQGITSQGDIRLQAVTVLNNQQGNLSTKGNLVIQSEQIDNQQGNLVSQQQVSLTGNTLDNRQGTIQAQQNIEITANREINNQAITTQGSVIQSGATLTLITNQLNNQDTKATTAIPTQGLLGHQLTLSSKQLDNQRGGIYTTDQLSASVAQDIHNQQGEILSLGNVNLQGDSLILHNQQGIIESGQNLRLVLQQFNDEGNIKSHQDALIELQKDLILTQPFVVAGHLAIKTMGDFINQTQLITGKGLQITAKQIENPINSEFTSPNTQLTANSLTNRGLIDGTQNAIYVNTLNNLGTGRIYGDELAIQANVLNNQPEHSNNEVHTATIAARKNLHLGVGTLTNSDHALILSLGDLTIGGQIDANQRAIGQADFVDNGSATIEALGNGKINTKRLWNHDLHLITGEDHQDQRISEYAVHSKGKRYSSLEGWFDRNNNNRHDKNSYFNFNDGRPRVGNPTWVQWHFNRHTVTTTLEHRDPAKILIAGDLRLNGEDLVNDVSQILVGNRIRMGGRVFNQNEKNRNLKGNSVRLENKDLIGEIHRHDEGTWYTMVTKRKRHGWRGKKVWAKYGDDDKPFSRDLPVKYFNFNLVENTIGQTQAVINQATNTTIDGQHQATTLAKQTLNVAPVSSVEPHQISAPALPHIISVEMSQAVGKVRTYQPKIRLPEVSLYRINPNTDSHILVETDPRFTNKRQWLSSDYMFNALRADPQTMLKRLGDGYYEQRLVNEQINQLTGQRFLGNYTSDYEQYKALMDAGIRYAQRYQLIPGVALSAAQMQELTEDMVWLAPQTVTLKDGTQVQVLVPQVYLVKRDVDIQPTGAIISAREIEIDSEGEVNNSGVIAGRNLTQISAQNVVNTGTLAADQLNFQLAKRFYQQGGELNATNLYLNAGSIQIEGRMSEAKTNPNYAHRQLDQQALLQVKRALILQSQGDIQLDATSVNAGSALLTAGGDIHIGTVTERERSHYIANSENYWKLDQQREIGSTFEIKDNAVFNGTQGVMLRAAQINAGGDLIVNSEQGDIQLQAGRDQETLSFATKYKDKSLLSRSTTIIKHDHQYDLAQGSQLSGNNIAVTANQGKVSVEGSTIVADKNVTLQGQELDISAAKNTRKEDDFYAKKKSGLMSGGSLAFTIGSRKQATDTANQQTYYQGSQIGALQGDIYLAANDSYRQQGSRITAGEGDITILAKKVDITTTEDKFIHDYQHTFKQSGLTFGINLPIVQAAQQIQQTAKSVAQVGDAKDNRINALAAINAAFDLANTADVVGNVASKIANQGVQGLTQNIGISVGYGKQKNEQTIHTETTTANRSKVNAAGKVNVLTTGDKNSSYIQVKGSDIAGQQGTTLLTQGNLDITAQQQTHSEQSQNKSSGWNAGVAVNYNSAGGASLGITVGGNAGKGYSNGEETTWVNSHIGDKQSQTTLISGKDLTIQGGQVVGDSVKVQADNLNITSLQDTATYQGKQKQTSAQMTVGYGASLSGNYNQSKINADYASVNQQSGILAGDGGYNVNVDKKVDLKGGAILSTATADKNGLSAQTFTFSDITNYSKAKASAVGFNAGFSIGRDQTSEQDKKDNQIYRAEREKNGETFHKANPNQQNSSPIKFGLGEKDVHSADLYAVSKIGLTNLLGNTKKSESDSSVTASVISEGKFTISDQQGQENIKRITKDVIEQTNSLKQKDYQDLQKEVETDSAIKKGFLTNTAGFTDEAYRTMFIAEHRMFTAKIDENGNPIKDKELTQALDEEARQAADKKLQNGEITQAEYDQEVENYKNDQLGKGRNIYELREVSDQEREHLKQVTYTDPITGKTETRYVVAFNGIFNDKNAAAKFSRQNYIAKQGESGEIDTRIYKDVYFVHHPQANNAISELLIAGYEKMLEGELGTTLGISNSSAQAVTLMKQYGTDNLFVGAHSRGTLTVTNALNILDSKENQENKLLSGTRIKMVGPAANVSRADNTLSYLQTGEKRTSAEGSIRIENHQSDVVGSLPIILGGNPATMKDNWKNHGFGKKLLDIFGDNSSVHNCYGLGQPQCTDDGYRKKDNLIMNKERTIFELNNQKQEK